MDIAIGIAALIFAAATIFLFIRQAELVGVTDVQKNELTKLERDNKKLRQQLETTGKKLSKTAGQDGKKKAKAKGRQDKLDRQASDMGKLKLELKDQEEKVKKLSRDLNRVRIDREEMRQKMVKLEAAPSAAPVAVAAVATNDQASEPAPKPQVVEQAPQRKATPSQLEREVERAGEEVAKAHSRVERYRQSLVVRESELRHLRRSDEHNRRAYIITQLQLDLANDEIYVLQNGEPPPYKQVDKQKKRSALRPESRPESIEILNRDNPIDLTAIDYSADDGTPEAVAETPAPVVAASPVAPKAEPAPAPKAAEVAPKAAAKPAPKKEEGFSLGELAKPPEKAEAKEEPKPESKLKPGVVKRPAARGSLLEQLKSRGTATRLRKKTGSSRVAAPPRPDAPPRPGGE